mmetsp:Transcript_81883/g.250241  ORF Transcript_81883/g.250241 Transcript_81883/m.250241 type:complete len:282 (-) Transcript_81883:537-1382(-)
MRLARASTRPTSAASGSGVDAGTPWSSSSIACAGNSCSNLYGSTASKSNKSARPRTAHFSMVFATWTSSSVKDRSGISPRGKKRSKSATSIRSQFLSPTFSRSQTSSWNCDATSSPVPEVPEPASEPPAPMASMASNAAGLPESARSKVAMNSPARSKGKSRLRSSARRPGTGSSSYGKSSAKLYISSSPNRSAFECSNMFGVFRRWFNRTRVRCPRSQSATRSWGSSAISLGSRFRRRGQHSSMKLSTWLGSFRKGKAPNNESNNNLKRNGSSSSGNCSF